MAEITRRFRAVFGKRHADTNVIVNLISSLAHDDLTARAQFYAKFWGATVTKTDDGYELIHNELQSRLTITSEMLAWSKRSFISN